MFFALLVSAALQVNALPADAYEYTPCTPIPYRGPNQTINQADCARYEAEMKARRDKEVAADRKARPRLYSGMKACLNQLASAGYDPASFHTIGFWFMSKDIHCVCEDPETQPHLKWCKDPKKIPSHGASARFAD